MRPSAARECGRCSNASSPRKLASSQPVVTQAATGCSPVVQPCMVHMHLLLQDVTLSANKGACMVVGHFQPANWM